MNKRTLHKISYGLYVISSIKGQEVNGQICNSVIQVTSEPPHVAICINKQNYTHEFVTESRKFVVNILSQDADMLFIGRFGFKCGRQIDKFDGINHRLGDDDIPILEENSIGWIAADVVQEVDVGTHTMFIGKVKDADIILDGEPMTYDYYHKELRGKAPKTATTYIGD